MTALNDGGFVVTWSSDGQDGSGYGIYGQRYAADGTPVGSEFRANTFTSSDQAYSSVTALNDGGFVVTWSSYWPGRQRLGHLRPALCGGRHPSGGASSAPTRITSSDQTLFLRDGAQRRRLRGDVVVARPGRQAAHYGIYGQRYAADGTPVGSEFRANTYTSSDQVYSSVTALNDGGFVVTWSSTARTAAARASTASAMRRTAAPWGTSSAPTRTPPTPRSFPP